MTRAVVFLTATLLFASLGAVSQNAASPGGGGSTPTQASAPAQSTPQPATPASAPATTQRPTTPQSDKAIQGSARGEDPRVAGSSAELPQTSTILPLLGLLGLGSLVAGLFARR